MQTKQVVIGLLIFAVVTILLYGFLEGVMQINEGVSVVIALLVGGLVEFFYRKKTKDK